MALALAALPGAAIAHEGSARLILEPDRVAPGGVVTIRGEDLGADDEMGIALLGPSAGAELATIATDGQGHFTLSIQVPGDAPAGAYAVRAVAATGYDLAAVLLVEGAPIIDGAGAPPGQDEGLPAIAPVASGPSGAAPAAPATSRPVVVSGDGPATSEVDVVPLVALAGAIAALAFLVWRTGRRPARPASSADLS
jgi:hypothetical protein